MDLSSHLPEWIKSKSKIFSSENFLVSARDIVDAESVARCIELRGNSLHARALLWGDGRLELEATNEQSVLVVQSSRTVRAVWELDDSLNWWLSEVAIYSSPKL